MGIKRYAYYLGLLGIYWVWASTAYALSTDRKQPITIQADQVTVDDLKKITRYQGNVEIHQGSVHIVADSVRFVFDTKKQLDKIFAEGKPARFSQLQDGETEPVRAHAQHIEYHAKQDMVHLLGLAEIKQGIDTFSGERIRYDASRSLITADGGESSNRVKVTISPRTQDEAGNE